MSYDRIQSFTFTKDSYLPKVPPPFLVDGVLHRSQTIIFGQTNAGKSMLALSLAAAVASGRNWNGRTVNASGPVAIVSGDPDGLYETYERLDKVRDDVAGGEIRIHLPERPLAKETWFEIRRRTEGCKLMILDNLTQFVPGTLSDDLAVKLVYEQLEALSREHGMAICVLAHCSDKKNEHGYSSNIPSGSFVIRSVPRWFVHLNRTRGTVVASMSGNSGGRPWELTLSEPTDTPRFSVIRETPADELAERRGQRQQQRDTKTLDENRRIKAWMATHQGVPQRQAADEMTAELGFKVTQTRVSNVGKMDFEAA